MFDVPDYKLDPPEPHRDECSCDLCHAWHLTEGCEEFAPFCQRCEDVGQYFTWLEQQVPPKQS